MSDLQAGSWKVEPTASRCKGLKVKVAESSRTATSANKGFDRQPQVRVVEFKLHYFSLELKLGGEWRWDGDTVANTVARFRTRLRVPY